MDWIPWNSEPSKTLPSLNYVCLILCLRHEKAAHTERKRKSDLCGNSSLALRERFYINRGYNCLRPGIFVNIFVLCFHCVPSKTQVSKHMGQYDDIERQGFKKWLDHESSSLWMSLRSLWKTVPMACDSFARLTSNFHQVPASGWCSSEAPLWKQRAALTNN